MPRSLPVWALAGLAQATELAIQPVGRTLQATLAIHLVGLFAHAALGRRAGDEVLGRVDQPLVIQVIEFLLQVLACIDGRVLAAIADELTAAALDESK